MERPTPAPLATENLLLYPIALTPESLTLGWSSSIPTVTMTLVGVEESAGEDLRRLLAVDGQPDGTIAIKRFWRGTFIFDESHHHVGAGFKAFRPLMKGKYGPRALTNAELEAHPSSPSR